MNGHYDQFLVETKALGFKGVEVSDGSTQMGATTRDELISKAREAGFFVISEVGKKSPELDHELTVDERLDLINSDLNHGAHYVILEAREAGKNIGIYDANGNIIDDELDALAANGTDQLIFEAPLKNQQVALILKYGTQVNLGNIAYDEVTSVETLRRGLRADTVGKV
jgi:phosphosulfolactate synthase